MQDQKGVAHMPSTQVITAGFNEEKDIGLTIAGFYSHLCCPLVVDGKSTDRTVEIAKNT